MAACGGVAVCSGSRVWTMLRLRATECWCGSQTCRRMWLRCGWVGSPRVVLRCSHNAWFLPQFCVIGPWPYGLLQELYCCVETLAEDVLGLTLKPMIVACPRCRQTKVSLKKVRDKGLKGESWFCYASCRTSAAAGPGRIHEGVARGEDMNEVDDEEMDEDEEEDGSSTDADLDGPLDMGTPGFATWIVGLDEAPNKRLRVVKQAIASAKKTKAAVSSDATAEAGDEPTADAQAAAIAKAQVEHVCRLVER